MNSPRFFSQLITSAIALALLRASQVQTAPVSATIQIEHYEVRGESVAEVRAALRARGPIDAQGNSRDAYTHWRLAWDWRLAGDGAVDPETIRLNVDIKIRIPQLVSSSEYVKERWGRYHQSMVRHELYHARHALEGARKLARIYQFADLPLEIPEAQHAADEILAEIRRADIAYDRTTENGRSEGIRW